MSPVKETGETFAMLRTSNTLQLEFRKIRKLNSHLSESFPGESWSL